MKRLTSFASVFALSSSWLSHSFAMSSEPDTLIRPTYSPSCCLYLYTKIHNNSLSSIQHNTTYRSGCFSTDSQISCTCWRHQYSPVYTKGLKISSAHFDRCLYYQNAYGKLIGVIRLVTDDTESTGSLHFSTEESKAISRFITNYHSISKGKEFQFFGQQVTMYIDGLGVPQYSQINEMGQMNTAVAKINQKEFRNPRGKLTCINQTPDLLYAYAAARLSQMKPDQADSDDVIALKKSVGALKAILT